MVETLTVKSRSSRQADTVQQTLTVRMRDMARQTRMVVRATARLYVDIHHVLLIRN